MKISNLLIAALVTSSLVSVSQTEHKPKKPIAKTEKVIINKERGTALQLKADTTKVINHRYCPACGRG